MCFFFVCFDSGGFFEILVYVVRNNSALSWSLVIFLNVDEFKVIVVGFVGGSLFIDYCIFITFVGSVE